MFCSREFPTNLPREVSDVDVGAVDDVSLWVDRGGIGQGQDGKQQGDHGGELCVDGRTLVLILSDRKWIR